MINQKIEIGQRYKYIDSDFIILVEVLFRSLHFPIYKVKIIDCNLHPSLNGTTSDGYNLSDTGWIYLEGQDRPENG